MSLLYIHCYSQGADCQWAGVFPLFIQSRGEVGENPLSKCVIECVYCCRVGGVEENYLSFVTVQFYSNLLRLLLQRELGAGRGLSPERVSVTQANHPETLSRVEKDGALPFDGLLGHSDVPVFASAHLYSPAVLSRCVACRSQHTHTAAAALGVVR